jgi:hypothetical protein
VDETQAASVLLRLACSMQWADEERPSALQDRCAWIPYERCCFQISRWSLLLTERLCDFL